MTTCIIAEKPSVARDIARIVGATSKQNKYMGGCGYVVTWAMGHLIALVMPEVYGFFAYKAEDLPICFNSFQLVVRQVRKNKEYQLTLCELSSHESSSGGFRQAELTWRELSSHHAS